MRKNFVPVVVLLLVASVGLTGCATKKWVNEQISSYGQVTATRISEVEGSVEGNQKAISDLSAKQEMLEKDVAKLSATAQDALMRATEAEVLAVGKFLFEVTVTDNGGMCGFDKYELSDEAKASLDEFAAVVNAVEGNAYIEVQGHTDNIGSEG